MRQLDYTELRTIMVEQPYRLLFATVSGAHPYGFPSRDSDLVSSPTTWPSPLV